MNVMNREDFCELAIMAALDRLDERDRSLVASVAQSSPELAADQLDIIQTVAALGYAAPSLPLSDRLQERLLQRIELEECPTLLKTRSQDLVWQDHVVPGVRLAVLHCDTARRQLSCLVRCEPNTTYPPHRHAEFEEIFLLEGDITFDGESYQPGDYFFSAGGSIHAPQTVTGCLFFVRTSLDDEFV